MALPLTGIADAVSLSSKSCCIVFIDGEGGQSQVEIDKPR